MGWLLICSMLLIAMRMVHCIAQGPAEVENWFQNLSHKKEKVTKLHFYFHDTITGENPIAVQVAKANTTLTSPTLFGLVNIIDDPLTVGPEPNSTIVGRAQGFYGLDRLEQLGLIVSFNFVFTAGKYKGSTLSVLGQNQLPETYREIPIVGGSGVFRLARGIATAKTNSINLTTGNAVAEYHVVVVHY